MPLTIIGFFGDVSENIFQLHRYLTRRLPWCKKCLRPNQVAQSPWKKAPARAVVHNTVMGGTPPLWKIADQNYLFFRALIKIIYWGILQTPQIKKKTLPLSLFHKKNSLFEADFKSILGLFYASLCLILELIRYFLGVPGLLSLLKWPFKKRK